VRELRQVQGPENQVRWEAPLRQLRHQVHEEAQGREVRYIRQKPQEEARAPATRNEGQWCEGKKISKLYD